MAEVIEELGAFASNQESPKVRSTFAARREEPPRIGFVMSGQGPQWWGMGRELMQHEPVFRRGDRAMRRCVAPVGKILAS